jgi:UDP:flavonoid glycosyltransferase YjiC (YdhE family)
MSYHFLLSSWGSLGNMSPLLTAARRLRHQGHHVRVMADPVMRSEIEAADFAWVSWRRAPIGADADPADFSDMKDWIRKAVFDPAAAYAADIRDEISRLPTDAVLSLDILLGVAMGAEAAGVPLAFLSPHVSIRTLPGMPPATSGLGQPKTAEERAEIDAANAQLEAAMDSFLPVLNGARAELGLPMLAGVMEAFDRVDRLLLATSQAFDFQADLLPDNLRYIGPLLDVPNWSKFAPACSGDARTTEIRTWHAPWPARADRPRVLLGCSTGAQGQRDIFQRIINAAGMLDIDAVATTGPNVAPAELRAPGNVYLRRGAPHDLVMREVSVVVSQGGHGTVTRALVQGLPQLILPMARDQAANAARIEAKGAGLRLPPTASEIEIASAVNRLLTEPHFKTAARRVGEAVRADMEDSILVDEMESIAAAGRAARQHGERGGLRGTA